jgi:D-beta-D-heptose 7-phosphate kinase/D-beta-D-heptose 1-phosphate adenosyltransferase
LLSHEHIRSHLHRQNRQPTITKTRIVSRQQQVVRLDHEEVFDEAASQALVQAFAQTLTAYQLVLFSDYNKGTVTYELIEEIINSVTCPIFIDTKKTDLERFQGAWVKINELEYSKIKSECTGLIVTLGSKGAVVPHHDLEFAAPLVEVADVTGAGDTFLAALVSEYLTHKDIEPAIRYAIRAASVTVQHLGVYAPTWEELE